MNLQIRLAAIEEAPLVHHIMQAAFAEYIGVLNPPSGANRETVADVEQAMADGGAVLAWDGSVAVGSARFRLEPDCFYVGRLAVLPQWRGAAVGQRLMGYLEHLAVERNYTAVRLVVRMSLPQNLEFYKRLGYSIVEIGMHPKAGDQIATFVKQVKVAI